MNQFPQLHEQQQMIVTSCDDTDDFNDDEESVGEVDSLNDIDDNNIAQKQKQTQQQQLQKPDDLLLFDEDADDEDEAYVYKNLRSGMMETINVVHRQQTSEMQPSTSNDPNNYDANSNTMIASSPTTRMTKQGPYSNVEKLKVLKPRNTDAVLSCPYCFHIVCMDCQRHTSYKNQYRAMFVMNVVVRWDIRLQYNDNDRCLIPNVTKRISNISTDSCPDANVISDTDYSRGCHNDTLSTVPNDRLGTTTTNNEQNDTTDTIYYTVCCANCQTTVAVLDMTDEVYHFSGCLASS